MFIEPGPPKLESSLRRSEMCAVFLSLLKELREPHEAHDAINISPRWGEDNALG
jgi:hypothetical protein